MKRRSILSVIVLLVLVEGLVYALIPPPPVNQNIGVYDTLFANFSESKCRGCHTSGVPDNHHNLVPTGEYQCMNCHPVITNPGGSQSITMLRDCMQCHDTTFNGMTIPRPHHETQDALDRHCSRCHGNLVDDYDDGHIIREGPPSKLTPDTKYKVINQTSGRKWGGCESCHEVNNTMDPVIASNNKTHHRLGSLSGFEPQNNSKCATCHGNHSSPYGPDSIRNCEQCHGIDSLHNIQYDFANTSNLNGYGHLGLGDCNGCHASYVAGFAASIAPDTDIIVPIIDSLSTSKVDEGTAATLTIRGSNFVTDVTGVTHSSVVILTDGKNALTINPISITTTEIIATVPPLKKGVYGIHALKNGSIKSNKMPLVSSPKLTISSVMKINSTTVSITGTGFGTYDSSYKDLVNVTIKKGSASRSVQITSWSDTLIIVYSPDTSYSDMATVNSIYGTASAKITK